MNGFSSNLTGEPALFQKELRDFIEREWQPTAISDPKYETRVGDFLTRAIGADYWLRDIPKEYGGAGATPDLLKMIIIDEEFSKAGIRPWFGTRDHLVVGQQLLIPTLLAHGTEAQKARFIPPTLTGELIWAQGYSEPETGSDLASVQTKAEKRGDMWIVNGHKIWTTSAAIADYMFCLCRTDPDAPKHKGLSYLLIDMKNPGIDAQPLHILTGAPHFGEVILTDVEVPDENMVGEPGAGWKVGNSTLSAERSMVGSGNELSNRYDTLVALARTQPQDQGAANELSCLHDPAIQDELLCIEGLVQSHKLSVNRQLSLSLKGSPLGRLPLLNKLSSTTISERMARLAGDMLGEDGLTNPPADDIARGDIVEGWRKNYLWALANAIAGGASNIQRRIIAERGLGMPRDRTR